MSANDAHITIYMAGIQLIECKAMAAVLQLDEQIIASITLVLHLWTNSCIA